MLRNRLRTLEQQVNAMELPDDAKVKLQSYVSGCYGSLTSFNILFADEDDQFKGRASKTPRACLTFAVASTIDAARGFQRAATIGGVCRRS